MKATRLHNAEEACLRQAQEVHTCKALIWIKLSGHWLRASKL